MSTSQKHRNFIAEPMGEKAVSELAGIGPVLSGRFVEKGFDQVRSRVISQTDALCICCRPVLIMFRERDALVTHDVKQLRVYLKSLFTSCVMLWWRSCIAGCSVGLVAERRV